MGNVNPPKHGTSQAAQQFIDKLAELGLAHVGGGIAMRRPAKEDAEQARRKVYALANQALG